MKRDPNSKKPSSFLSYIRTALTPANKGDDIAPFPVSSPHIRSDPVPAGFRKPIPLRRAQESVSRLISIESRCSPPCYVNSLSTSFPRLQHDEPQRGLVGSLGPFQCDSLSLPQHTFTSWALSHSVHGESEENEWESASTIHMESETFARNYVSETLRVGCGTDTVGHWLEEQTSLRSGNIS